LPFKIIHDLSCHPISSSAFIAVLILYNSNLFCHVTAHSVVRLPFLFSSINIEASTSAKVPALILTLNVTTTC